MATKREYDFNKAAELEYGKLPELKKHLEELESKANEGSNGNRLLRDNVSDEEIAKIVCRWTGIPVSKLMEGEKEKILGLEGLLHKRVIGQDEAVTKVSEAIMRSRAGICAARPFWLCPAASCWPLWMFTGPSRRKTSR